MGMVFTKGALEVRLPCIAVPNWGCSWLDLAGLWAAVCAVKQAGDFKRRSSNCTWGVAESPALCSGSPSPLPTLASQYPHPPTLPSSSSQPQAKRQAQLEHLVAAKRLEDRVAGILARVERELDDAGGWGQECAGG